jgi:hypothetical protein
LANTIFEQSTSAGSNTSIGGVDQAEGCAPSTVNNATRAIVAMTKGALIAVSASGTDTYTATLAPAPAAYVTGAEYHVTFASANLTTTPTINFNSLGAKTIVKEGNAALAAGDIPGSHEGTLRYNGTNMVLKNPKIQAGVLSIADATNGALAFSAATGAVTGSISPSDATAKASPVAADLFLIGDSAASFAVKKSTGTQVASGLRSTFLSGSIHQIVNTETGAVSTGTTTIPLDDTIPQNTEGDQYMSLAVTPTNSSSTLLIDIVVNMATSAAGGLMCAALFQDITANALAANATYTGAAGAQVTLSFRHTMTAGTILATTFKVRAGADRAGTTTFNGFASGRIFGGVAASSITITEILP